MSYMWQDFNIKTFPAETVVYRNGVFQPELSTLQSCEIKENYDLPVHIIYIGEIAGKNDINIQILPENQKVFLTVKIENKKPAFLNIFIKNTGENSEIHGNITLFNNSELDCDVFAGHFNENTGILLNTKLIAGVDSVSKLSATAEINKNCPNCNSDITFSALAAENAKITFLPEQKIYSVPENAKHGASIFEPTTPQIQYLRESGLSSLEIQDVLKEAFINNNPLF